MAFAEFFERKKQEGVYYGQNMEKLGQTRDGFLKLLVEHGVESKHSLGEVIRDRIFDYSKKGRTMTTVTMVPVGEWAERNNIQVEIVTIVSKSKIEQLQQADKKPIVHVALTLDDKTNRYAIPNDVRDSYAYRYTEYGGKSSIGDELFCVGLAEVMDYVQAGKLVAAKS